MKLRLLLACCLTFLMACDRSVDFLQKPEAVIPAPPEKPVAKPPVPPEPPKPPAPHFSETYKLSVSSFETYGSEVDVLWVIDNSGSMSPYQQQVIDNTSNFMQKFTNNNRLHWKMGLISTTIQDTPYLGFTAADTLDWKTPNPVPLFQNAVSLLGLNGSTEETFDPVAQHFGTYPDFLRKDAHLAIIIVTDELEQSYNHTYQTFYEYLKNLKGGDAGKILTYGVFPFPSSGCGYSFDYYQPGTAYYDFIQLTNGKAYDLCAADYGQNLAALGSDLVNHLQVLNPVIPVEKAANLQSIVVKHKGKVLKQGFLSEGGQWLYDFASNTIEIIDTQLLDASNPYFTVSYDLMVAK